VDTSRHPPRDGNQIVGGGQLAGPSRPVRSGTHAVSCPPGRLRTPNDPVRASSSAPEILGSIYVMQASRFTIQGTPLVFGHQLDIERVEETSEAAFAGFDEF
jgi:hypothetical protein